MNNRYMTLSEFCEHARISHSTAYRMIRNGSLPAVKIQRNWKIPADLFLEYEKMLPPY